MPSRPLGVAIWFLGAVVGHDLVLMPLYSLADWSAGAAIRRRAAQIPAVGWINYLRVPAVLSGLLFLVWSPLILRLHTRYQASTTLSADPFLWHWLAVTGALFLLSAAAFAVRMRTLPALSPRPRCSGRSSRRRLVRSRRHHPLSSQHRPARCLHPARAPTAPVMPLARDSSRRRLTPRPPVRARSC